MSSSRIKSDEIQMGDNYVLPIEQTRVTRQQAKVQQIIDETDKVLEAIFSFYEKRSTGPSEEERQKMLYL